MRQLWRHASRARLFLVVAGVCVLTLAASSPIYSAVRGSQLSVHSSPSPAAGMDGAKAKADCSLATALQLVQQHDLNDFLLPNPVQQVLCGPFAGPGSEAMAPDEEGVRAARAATPVGRRAAGRMTLPRFIHCPPRVSAATRLSA